MKPITVSQLWSLCYDEMVKGNGNKVIMLSDDDEGNGYHYLWYAFNEIDELSAGYVEEDVASKENTITLG